MCPYVCLLQMVDPPRASCSAVLGLAAGFVRFIHVRLHQLNGPDPARSTLSSTLSPSLSPVFNLVYNLRILLECLSPSAKVSRNRLDK